MKKIIVTLVFCISAILNIQAQEKFGTYTSLGVDYNIKIEAKKSSYRIFIECASQDALFTEVGFIIDGEKRKEKFISTLLEAKAKYIEWTTTAKQNNVKDYTKQLDLYSRQNPYFNSSSKINIVMNIPLLYRFMVKEQKDTVNYILGIYTNQLTSSANQFVKCDGILLIFNSPDEIDKLLTVISDEKVNEFMAKPKTNELFKN